MQKEPKFQLHCWQNLDALSQEWLCCFFKHQYSKELGTDLAIFFLLNVAKRPGRARARFGPHEVLMYLKLWLHHMNKSLWNGEIREARGLVNTAAQAGNQKYCSVKMLQLSGLFTSWSKWGGYEVVLLQFLTLILPRNSLDNFGLYSEPGIFTSHVVIAHEIFFILIWVLLSW